MKAFTPVYVPVGVGTFHMPSADEAFARSCELLKGFDPNFVCPEDKLLSVDALRAYLEPLKPDLIVFQNLTFANAAYMSEVLRRFDCPLVLWTLREPVIDGGRLRLNSLTGAYSAANALRAFGNRPFVYVYGAPDDPLVMHRLLCALAAARVKKDLRTLKLAAVGHTPQGFGFGRALDAELLSGVELETVEARELIRRAKAVSEADCTACLEKTAACTCGFENTPEQNRVDHAKLLRAYLDYVNEKHIGALASRCWPDFFTDYGTPVCTVLSMLNDEGVAAACEADVYGALSMWIGMQLSGEPVFFGDPVSLGHRLPGGPGARRQLPLLPGRGGDPGQAQAVHRHLRRRQDRRPGAGAGGKQRQGGLRAPLRRPPGPPREDPGISRTVLRL